MRFCRLKAAHLGSITQPPKVGRLAEAPAFGLPLGAIGHFFDGLMSRPILLAALALGSATASAQSINTQLDGFTFTNGITSLTDNSGLYLGFDTAIGESYLLDNELTTMSSNLGAADGGAIQAQFAGPISGSATGIYLVGPAFNGNTVHGSFSLAVELTGGLMSAISYDDADFVKTTQTVASFDYYRNTDGVIALGQSVPGMTYSYLYVSFASLGVSGSDVVGLRLSDFTASYLDIMYIGAGYAGAPIPEPSTYGLALGGLVLAAAALRRRKISK